MSSNLEHRFKKVKILKDHDLWKDEHYGTEPPCITYELRSLINPQGEVIEGLNSAWIILNNPSQLNSYTTKMVKGVIAAFSQASMDRSVVCVVFTGDGDRAFCTGGNTKEYAEYYSGKPTEYGLYMDLFNTMVDSILNCKKPVICRANGMRIAGGQEIGMACDITISADTAVYGQAGPRHGSAPDGGSTDFLPWYLGIEDAMWNCVSCEVWSSYKMKRLGLITQVIPVLKNDDKFIKNPTVIIDSYVDDGEIVFGEFHKGEKFKEGRKVMKNCTVDFKLLDKAVNDTIWKFANLFPGCLIKSIDGIRQKKKFFWDQTKLANRHWLSVNMTTEALLGFRAFNERKSTGKDVIDFIKYRQLLAEAHPFDQNLIDAVLPQPKE
ncbi:MAG: 6-oxocyclohex-1-ene-1-carbonyl-CoA hydratase [Candidatus Hodarchaeales archaeon]|jgi:6-oxo-cyclohex-1-ene-carbonyl-CoA hydrolase